MAPKKSVHDIRNDFLSQAILRDKLLKKASALSSKEHRLLDQLRQSCLHDVRCLHFLSKPLVRFCFMCGTREVAIDGKFTLIKAAPLRYIRDGQLTDPGRTVGPTVVQKMYSSLVSRTRVRGQKQQESCGS